MFIVDDSIMSSGDAGLVPEDETVVLFSFESSHNSPDLGYGVAWFSLVFDVVVATIAVSSDESSFDVVLG